MALLLQSPAPWSIVSNQPVRLKGRTPVVWDSEFVVVEDVGFRNCWLAAFVAYWSSHVTLRNSVIEGSTYALAAIGGDESAPTAHSFEVIGNLWKQSPSAYIPRPVLVTFSPMELPRQHLEPSAMGHHAPLLLEPFEWRSVRVEEHCGQRQELREPCH